MSLADAPLALLSRLEVVTTPDGEHWAVFARLCKPFRVDTWGQWAKVQKLPWACSKKILVHDASGREQELLCLSLRSVAGWLFTMNVNKVAEPLRPKLIRYQQECATTLADRFLGPRIDPALYAKLNELEVRVTAKDEEVEALKLRVELLDPDNAGVIGKQKADAFILSPLRTAARIRCASHEDFDQKTYRSFLRVFENEVRQHVDYPAGRAQRWSELELLRFGRAVQRSRSSSGSAPSRSAWWVT